jgi:DnaJ-domain-containing protein 1
MDSDERAPAIPESPGLSDYYLDWRNFFDSNEEDVQALLDGFWIRFSRFECRADALALLELEADASQQQISRRYRELAGRHHPDKGGDRSRFVCIRQAYELLKY